MINLYCCCCCCCCYCYFEAIIAVLALGLATGLAVGLGNSIHNYSSAANGNSSHGSADGVCTSHACVKLSSQIISFMDGSIDPCQDFYQFACNGYLKDAIIPNGMWITQ